MFYLIRPDGFCKTIHGSGVFIMKANERSTFRTGNTFITSSVHGELAHIADARRRFRLRGGVCSWLSLLLALWSISPSATAQTNPGGAPARVSPETPEGPGSEQGATDTAARPGIKEVGPDAPDDAPEASGTPTKTDPEITESPPAAHPVDATLPSEEPPRGTVVFVQPASSAEPSTTATEASDSIAGPQPVSTRGEHRDGASTECEAEWMREGLYLRILDGVGFAHLFGDGPSDSTSISGMGSISALAIGGSIAPRLVLAVTMQAVQTSGDFERGPFAGARLLVEGNEMPASVTASATAALLGGFVDWYPMESSGLHLGLGVGLNSLMVVNGADDSTLVGIGGGAALVVGYDWPVARTWAFGIALVASGATRAVLMESESGDDTDYDLMPISVGLSGSILYF